MQSEGRYKEIYDVEEGRDEEEEDGMGKEEERRGKLFAKKFDEDYKKTQNYLKFSKKFDLPQIKTIGVKLTKRNFDTSPYNRALRVGRNKSSDSIENKFTEISQMIKEF